MGPRKIRTLNQAWAALAYEQDALAFDRTTADLAPSVDPLLVIWDDVWRGDRQVERTLARAQVRLADTNFRGDGGVDAVSRDLLHAAGGKPDARFRRYFPIAPSRLTERALPEMVTRMTGWVASLAGEPEPEIQRHAPIIEALAAAARTAIDEMARARNAAADRRLRVLEPFLAQVNAFNLNLQGELQKRAAAAGLGADWVAKFFLPPEHAPAQKKAAPAGAPHGA